MKSLPPGSFQCFALKFPYTAMTSTFKLSRLILFIIILQISQSAVVSDERKDTQNISEVEGEAKGVYGKKI